MIVGYPGDSTIVVENSDVTGYKYDCDQVMGFLDQGQMMGCNYRMVAAGVNTINYWYAVFVKETLPEIRE